MISARAAAISSEKGQGKTGMKQSNEARRLFQTVEAHVPLDAEEAKHRDHVLRFLSTAERPLDRNVYDPGHITGSAFVASDDGSRTLLIHHAKLNRWLQPGGHAEAGEVDARHVARREAEEEVGLATEDDAGELFDIDVHASPARGADQPAHYHFDLRYLFLVPHSEIRAAAEVLDARWFALAEAEFIVNEPGLRRMIGKVRARFAR